MTSQRRIWLAALVKVRATLGPEALVEAAAAAGFEAPKPTPQRVDVGMAYERPERPPKTESPVSFAPVPFLRAVEAWFDRPLQVPGAPPPPSTAPRVTLTAQDEDNSGRSFLAVPPAPPAETWPRLWPRLRRLLRQPARGTAPDVRAAVRLIAKGRVLTDLPRRARWRWPHRLEVWLDRDRHNLPLFQDQDEVVERLERLIGERAVAHEVVREASPRRRRRAGRRPEVVLALTDLGAWGHAGLPARWSKAAKGLAAASVRACALVPGRGAGAPGWATAEWAPRPSPAGGAKRAALVDALWARASVATLVKPALFRVLRQLVPGADLATEYEALRDPRGGGLRCDGDCVELGGAAELAFPVWRAPGFSAAECGGLHRDVAWMRAEGGAHGVVGGRPRLGVGGRRAAGAGIGRSSSGWMARWSPTTPMPTAGGGLSGRWPRGCRKRRLRATTAWRSGCAASGCTRTAWGRRRWRRGPRCGTRCGRSSTRHPRRSRGWPSALAAHARRPCPGRRWRRCGPRSGWPCAGGRRCRWGAPRGCPETGGGSWIPPHSVWCWRPWTPPEWAVEAGRDRYGLWAAFAVEDVRCRLRWIPPGQYIRGSPEGEEGRYRDEGPQHSVTLTRGFWLGETPVTQALWEAVNGGNPSGFTDPRRPVEQVSWDDCQSFCAQLLRRSPQLRTLHPRLPTEAEWEYACRAGTTSARWAEDLEAIRVAPWQQCSFDFEMKGRTFKEPTRSPPSWRIRGGCSTR